MSKATPKLIAIVYPQISSFSGVFNYTSTEKAHYDLYSEFSKFIRGIYKNINGYFYPLRSIDNKKLGMRRSKFVDELVNNVPFYKIRGTPEEICKVVDTLFLA